MALNITVEDLHSLPRQDERTRRVFLFDSVFMAEPK